MAFYLNGEAKKALRDWEQLAGKKNADALFNLGQVYRLGQGAPSDERKAEGYYRRAADLGHTPAIRELGTLYIFRGQTPDSRAQGVALLENAAARGDARAEYVLGVLYFGGDLAARDPVRAYAWTLLALDGGLSEVAQSEAAQRRALSETELARALELSRTLLTGELEPARFGLLIGEMPAPRRAAAGRQPAGVETAPLAVPDATEGGGASAQASDLALPEEKPARTELAEAVGHAEALATPPSPLSSSASPPEGESASESGEALVETPKRDLGAPDSPLVSPEGFAGSWSIQLASFRTPEKADAEWRDLLIRHAGILSGATRKIIRSDLGEGLGVRYRLRAGPFAAKADAEAACAQLGEAGESCLVIRP